jgi:very-short-patch-repair endonuclease
MAAHDGIAPVSVLAVAGHSRRALERALDRGLVQRVRNGWVALASADPLLVAAAKRGVVLTCVTQAKRVGLFVLHEPRQTHVAARPHSGRAGVANARVHWAQPMVPRHPNVLVDSVENVLALVAGCLPYEEALVVWESAFRTGQADPHTMARYSLPPAARRILEDAGIFSDSGLETLLIPRLRWLGLPIRRQIWVQGHRVDLLIADRLVLQVDGGHHVGAQRESDISHDAALTLMGYHVIRVGYAQVVHRWHEVQDLVMRAVAQGLHLAR